MTEILSAGPINDNLVVYSLSGRVSHYGAIFSWPDTEKKVIYDLERKETFWLMPEMIIINAHSELYARMCAKGWWNGLLGNSPRHVVAKIFSGRIKDGICEVNFASEKTNGDWIPLTEVTLVGHINAKKPS